MKWSDLFIPLVIGGIVVFGILKRVNVFDAFVEGAFAGMKVVYKITPTMIVIMLGVGMLKASGGLDLLSFFFEPLVSIVHIPHELVPLMLMRPISGTGALAVFKDILARYGADTQIGKIASVMQGSTETTFYTIAMYYGVTKVKKTRHTLAAAAAGDATGFVFSALAVLLLMS